jgi:glycosyltransferase involved in cell wall biosynthesis
VKLSVIIPVYRVEATLNRCVGSVASQSYADLEIILVDDGSPDNCPRLCDEWAQRDNRITAIHKANGGLSDARNHGIDRAQGDYITFVDSDDYLAPDTLAPLMKRLSEHPDIDLLEYPVYVAYGSDRQHKTDFTDETYHNMEAYWYDTQAYLHSYACNKIYHRRLFKDIRFPLGTLFEDMHTLPKLLKEARTVATSHDGLYYYCANPEGITATADGKALRMLLKPHADIISQSRRRDRDFQRYYMHVVNIQMDVYEQTGDSPILPQVHITPAHFSGITKWKAVVLNAIGIYRLSKLNKVIHKIWRNP